MGSRIDPDISRLIAEAFDIDIQMFYSKALSNLKKTPNGHRVSEWAENHPVIFKNMLRAISVLIHRVPENSRNLPKIISTHLERLPFEVYRIMALEEEQLDLTGKPEKAKLMAFSNMSDKSTAFTHFEKSIEKGKKDFRKGMVTGFKWFWGIVLGIFILSVFLIKLYG